MWHYGEVSQLVIILLWRGLPMLCEVTGGTEVALSVSLAVISFSTFHFDGCLCSVLVLSVCTVAMWFGLHCSSWWSHVLPQDAERCCGTQSICVQILSPSHEVKLRLRVIFGHLHCSLYPFDSVLVYYVPCLCWVSEGHIIGMRSSCADFIRFVCFLSTRTK